MRAIIVFLCVYLSINFRIKFTILTQGINNKCNKFFVNLQKENIINSQDISKSYQKLEIENEYSMTSFQSLSLKYSA